MVSWVLVFFFFQAEDGIRDLTVTGVQTCALPISEHGASDGLPMLLFHSAHLHAEMAGFDNHADTLRSDFFLDGLGDLAGKALLNLQAAREHVDHAGDLAEP